MVGDAWAAPRRSGAVLGVLPLGISWMRVDFCQMFLLHRLIRSHDMCLIN